MGQIVRSSRWQSCKRLVVLTFYHYIHQLFLCFMRGSATNLENCAGRRQASCFRSKATPHCLAIALLISGCNNAPPLETWPVQGTVVDQNGESPTGGVVRLLTSADSNLITVGPIQPDGTFTVHTQRRGFEYPGAVAGEYQVAVITGKTGPDGSVSPVRFDLPSPVIVKAGENEFALRIHR